MSNAENINKKDIERELPGLQLTDEQMTVSQQLLHLQSDIEEQCHRVAVAINPIAEALDTGRKVSHERMNHVNAQILQAHLQLDDLEQLLSSIDQQFTHARN